jgi:hypothetical protein
LAFTAENALVGRDHSDYVKVRLAEPRVGFGSNGMNAHDKDSTLIAVGAS